MRTLYLVKGVKKYPAFTGDSCEEVIKMLVPAIDVFNAEQQALNSSFIDEVKYIEELYPVSDNITGVKIV